MIIDFRVRLPHEIYRGSKLYGNLKKAEVQSLWRLGKGIPESAKQFSMALFMQEKQAAQIDKIVVPVRRFHGGSNQGLAALLAQYPEEMIGLAGIDPAAAWQDMQAHLDEIDDFVLHGPCRGIVLEPGQGEHPWMANDERALALYEYCQEHNIPIAMTFGGIATKSLRFYDPRFIDDIAAMFPKLKIALVHGGWPYVTEVSQIVINRQQIYLAPDFYMIESPGSADYIKGANHILQDRMIFSSAYPLIGLQEAVDYFANCGLTDAVLPKILYQNAMDFLDLSC